MTQTTPIQSGSWFWPFIFVVLVVLGCFNMFRVKQLNGDLRDMRQQLNEGLTLEEYHGMVSFSLRHTGQILKFPEMQAIGGEITPAAGDRMVMAFSEKSCNSCRDTETRYALALAKRIGVDRVLIIIGADSPRYVAAYRATNSVSMPVYFDKDGAFFKENGIQDTPMTILINERNEVLAAHFPAPDRPELSIPFRQAIETYFNPDS